MFFVTDDKSLVVLMSKPRSKWYALSCFGSKKHYRKDGSCKHTDEVLSRIKPDARPRVKVTPFGNRNTTPPQGTTRSKA